MRKFLKIIASLSGALLLLIIGGLGVATLNAVDVEMDIGGKMQLYYNLLPIIATVGGFGGSIICGILTLKNFFKIKTKKDKKD